MIGPPTDRIILRTPPELEEKIVRRYRNGDLDLRAVAAECGVSHQTAGKVLRRAGVEIEKRSRSRSRKWRPYADEIIRLYVDEDRPRVEIGRILSLIAADVSEALRSAGVEIKRGGHRSIVFPELREIKADPVHLPQVGGTKRNKYSRYYIMAKRAGIKVSVRVVDDEKVKVTRVL